MTTYREAGVDIDEGDRLVELIKPDARRTARPEVLAGIGGFAGMFCIPPGKYKEPVLVSGTDGVGTKLKLAFEARRHETVGIDLVAMSVNDVAVTGAEPLFFLDYFATSRLEAEKAALVIRGIAQGCVQAGCTLIGGETAEMPGFYAPGEYDLAGFAVGIVEKDQILDGHRVQVGDAIIGLASTGLHSNGYSLVRRVLAQRALGLDAQPQGLARPLADLLLEPTRIYVRDVLALAASLDLRALAHITGGGLPGNVPRTLPSGTRALLRRSSWPRPPIFDWLAREGAIAEDELQRTFNLGIGMTAIVPRDQARAAVDLLEKRGVAAWQVGEVVEGSGEAVAQVL
jgi:phosphoribosylformylglycinamidine cyclo-ligase